MTEQKDEAPAVDETPIADLIEQAFHATGPDAMKNMLLKFAARVEAEKQARDEQLQRIEHMLEFLTKP